MSTIHIKVAVNDGDGWQEYAFAVPGATFEKPVNEDFTLRHPSEGFPPDTPANPIKHMAYRAGMVAEIFQEYGFTTFANDPRTAAVVVNPLEYPL